MCCIGVASNLHVKLVLSREASPAFHCGSGLIEIFGLDKYLVHFVNTLASLPLRHDTRKLGKSGHDKGSHHGRDDCKLSKGIAFSAGQILLDGLECV